jgi:hypothetical protein
LEYLKNYRFDLDEVDVKNKRIVVIPPTISGEIK